MTNRNDALTTAEALLTPLAIPHVPQESSIEAVVDQWLHAIATDSQFYCNPDLSRPEELKNSVVSLLEEQGLYESRERFYDSVKWRPYKPGEAYQTDLFDFFKIDR